MRRLLVVVLLALSGVALAEVPAHACSCVAANTNTHIKNASDIFTATVVAKQRQARQLSYDLEVERVYKGDAGAEETLRTPAQGSACGLDNLAADRRYLVFGTRQGSVVEANSCGGTAPAATKLVGAVTGVLGNGSVPGTPAQEPITATLTPVSADAPKTFWELAWPGAVLAVVGLVGWLVLRRVGRAR